MRLLDAEYNGEIKGEIKGRNEGAIEGTAKSVFGLMKNLKCSLEQAMFIVDIPDDKQSDVVEYVKSLETVS